MSRYTRMLRKAARAAERSRNSHESDDSLLLDDVPDHIQARIEGDVLVVSSAPRQDRRPAHPTGRVHPIVHAHSPGQVNRQSSPQECQTAARQEADCLEERGAETPLDEHRPGFPGLPPNPWGPEESAADREEMTKVTGRDSSLTPAAPQESVVPAGPSRRSTASEGWLWPGKIRCGDLVVVVGDSGAGASTVTADWIARLTRGFPFPGCQPQDCRQAAEVLVFNALEEFAGTILPRITEMGGDSSRVLLASDQLLAWGAGEVSGDVPPEEGLEAQTRVRLQTSSALARLEQLLQRRQAIRMIVIDHLKLHIRCDSERVFEGLIHELASIARRNEVAIVLTQNPDAFRKSGGAARFLKSPSLVQCARSIWRIVASDSDRFGERVLDCLKLSHPIRGDKPGPWHLRLTRQGLPEWLRGRGGALLASSSPFHEQGLKTACRFLERELQIKEGVARWHELVRQATANGIDVRWLRDAVLKMNLDSTFDVSGDHQLSRIVGYPEDMVHIQRGLDAAHCKNSEDLRIFKTRSLEPDRPWRGEEEDEQESSSSGMAGEDSGWPPQFTDSTIGPDFDHDDADWQGPASEDSFLEEGTMPDRTSPAAVPIATPGEYLRSIKPEVGPGDTGEARGDLLHGHEPAPGRGTGGLPTLSGHSRAL